MNFIIEEVIMGVNYNWDTIRLYVTGYPGGFWGMLWKKPGGYEHFQLNIKLGSIYLFN